MSNSVNFTINFDGNADVYTKNMIRATGELKGKFDALSSTFGKFKANLVVFQQASQLIQGLSDTLKSTAEPGLKLNTSLHELSAITGVTGGKLKEIEGYARQTAKTFGGSAAQSVEAYKLVLSQLSPEIAKVPAALSSMGTSISTLSKTMGGNVAGATEVLTTAMNQFQVSTENPIAAAAEMAKMMNVMAAAAQAGSAELPQIKAALEQSGMAAKGANVSFAETNAAIQVLDKAGKKASEGGVALRNVLATLSQGRFLPKDVQQELSAAGVSVGGLTDTSLSLADRLSALSPIAGDAALMTKLFGKENANAATALMAGIGQMREWTVAISDTKSAEEQATIIMQSREEQMARYRAKIDDLKISFFNMTGNILPVTELITSAVVPIAQLVPLFSAMSAINFAPLAGALGAVVGKVKDIGYVSQIQFGLLKQELLTANMASSGFLVNIVRATAAIGRFATVGIVSGIKALGAYALSLVTTGATSATFAATSAGAFATLKVSAIAACKAIGIAIMNIPVFGWIAAALAALGAAAVWAYNKFEGFRKVVLGVWEVMKGFGTTLKDVFIETLKSILNGFSALGTAIWKLLKLDFTGAAADAKKAAVELFKASPIGIVANVAVKTAGRVQGDYKKGAEKAILKEEKEDVQDIQVEINEILAQTGGGPLVKTVVDSESIKQAKDLLAALPKKLEAIQVKNKILGDSETALKEQVDAVRSAIVNLTELGYGAQSSEIQGLISRLSGLREEQQKLIGTTQMQLRLNQIAIDQQKRLGKQDNPLKGSLKGAAPLDNNMSKSFNVLDSATGEKKNAFKEFQVFGDKMDYVRQMADITKGSIQELLAMGYDPQSAQIQGLVKELGDYDKMLGKLTPEQQKMVEGMGALGSMFSSFAGIVGEGAAAWLEWGANLLNVIAQAIPALVTMLGVKTADTSITAVDTGVQAANAAATMAATGAKAADTAVTQVNTGAQIANAAAKSLSAHASIPFVGIALGLAAVGSIIGAMMSIPKFANGGIVSGPTMALVGEYSGAGNNPEIIAPLNKLPGLLAPMLGGLGGGDIRVRIGVDELVGILKADNKKRRYF